MIPIKNDWGHPMTKSQQIWLTDFLNKYGEENILFAAITKGGYLSIDYKRKSNVYQYGRIIRGRKAGLISTRVGKVYDNELHEIFEGVETDTDLGSKRI